MAHQYCDGPERNVSCSMLTLLFVLRVDMLTIQMLKHAGMLEAQTSILSNFDGSSNVEPIWREWQRREHGYR
jgi:hypothetical protein